MRTGNSGITLIELILVIAVMAILVGIGGANYFGIRKSVVFENQLSEIAADLTWTRSRSIAQENDEQWGIRFTNTPEVGGDYYEIWFGDSYSAGTVAQRVNLHGSVGFLDPSSGVTRDIIFNKATGIPVSAQVIDLYALSGGLTGSIEVNSQGRVDIVF